MDRSHAACAKTWAPSAWFWMEASGSGGRIGQLSGHSTRQRLARLDWSCSSSREDASAFWPALVAYEMCADGAHCSTQCRSAREGIVGYQAVPAGSAPAACCARCRNPAHFARFYKLQREALSAGIFDSPGITSPPRGCAVDRCGRSLLFKAEVTLLRSALFVAREISAERSCRPAGRQRYFDGFVTHGDRGGDSLSGGTKCLLSFRTIRVSLAIGGS